MTDSNIFFILFPLLLVLAVAFLIFLLLRNFKNWYFKINRRVELLEEMNKTLKEINQKLSVR